MELSAQTQLESNNSVQFLGIDLDIHGDVLRPRAETELLGRAAQQLLDGIETAPVCVDMCCGSGNLALALATHCADACVWACDLSDDAIITTRHNVLRLGLEERIVALQGDMFVPMEDTGLDRQIDLIVCNPPYISTSRLLSGDRAHLLDGEPREAFDGGPYGITLHTRLINESVNYLKNGGWLAFEFGLGQDRQIAALLRRSRAFEAPLWHKNAQGDDRVVCARKL